MIARINRRETIPFLGGAAAWPLAARAQQGNRVRLIGVLMAADENDPVWKTYVSAFTQALAGLGWTDGRNVRMDLRWTGAAARNKVPAVYSVPYSARDGGLLSYGADGVDIFRRAATYVDRILRGDKPGDLPVQFPTKFEMDTATALGLAIPPSIMLRADEVIE
jgi:putative ABC transport system substrate-binding protein